jgi:hypothetical protein
MTPREVQLTIRAAGQRRLDRLDELVYAEWHGALWGGVQRVKKLPELREALTKRQPSRRRLRLTLEQDVARWQAWFAAAAPRKRKAN